MGLVVAAHLVKAVDTRSRQEKRGALKDPKRIGFSHAANLGNKHRCRISKIMAAGSPKRAVCLKVIGSRLKVSGSSSLISQR